MAFVKKMVTTSAENVAKDLLSGCQLTDAIMKQLCCKINSELAGLCSLTNPSLLRYAGNKIAVYSVLFD